MGHLDRKTFDKAIGRGYLLVLLAAVFVVIVAFFVFRTNDGAPAAKWEMGGVPFVPASSKYGNGYFSPVDEVERGNDEQ